MASDEAANFVLERGRAVYTELQQAKAEIGRLAAERDEWKAAADTEARARKQFHELSEQLIHDLEFARLCGKAALDFMNKIEGSGYGGMAEYEIARRCLLDMQTNNGATSATGNR